MKRSNPFKKENVGPAKRSAIEIKNTSQVDEDKLRSIVESSTLSYYFELQTIGRMHSVSRYWSGLFPQAVDANVDWKRMILRDFSISLDFLEMLVAQLKEKYPNYVINFALMYKNIHRLYQKNTRLVIHDEMFDDFYFLPENRESLLLMCIANNPPEDPLFPADEYYEWLKLAIVLHRNDIALKLHALLSSGGVTLLHGEDLLDVCVAANNREMLSYFFENNLTPQDGILFIAAETKNMDMFHLLKDRFGFKNAKGVLVITAVEEGRIDVLKTLAITRRQLEYIPWLAIDSNKIEVLLFLIDKYNIKAVPSFLYTAVSANNIQMIDQLRETFNFTVDDEDFRTAAASSSMEVINYLINNFKLNMHPSADEKHNQKLLGRAASYASLPTLKYLIETLGYVPTTKTLNASLASGSLEKTKYLKESCNIAINAASTEAAITGKNINVVKYLLGNNPLLNEATSFSLEQVAIIKYLLNLNIQNAHLLSPGVGANINRYTHRLRDAANTFEEAVDFVGDGAMADAWEYFDMSINYSQRQFFHYATDAYLNPASYGITPERLGNFNAHYHELIKTMYDAYPRVPIETKAINAYFAQLADALEKQNRNNEAQLIREDFDTHYNLDPMDIEPQTPALR